MKKAFAIQLKAAFLLFIFSLNMFVGFACSIGLTGVNSTSHPHPTAKKGSADSHSHEHGKAVTKSNRHENPKPHDHETDHKNAKEKKGCCNDEVQKVQQLDKNINSNVKTVANEIIANDPQTHYESYVVIFTKVNPAKLRERFFYPPPPNILVNIQRFQI